MEYDEAVKHLFVGNKCEGFEPSRQESPHLGSFLGGGQGDPQTQGKSRGTTKVRNSGLGPDPDQSAKNGPE